MKKKFVIFLVIVSLLTSSTVAYAAGGTTIKAILSNLKIYYGNSKVSGSVITYKNVKYVPAKILSDNLGFKVSASSSKLTITETESKEYLQNKIDSLSNENTDLKSQVDVLNEKLRFYSGGEEDYTNQSESDYYNSLNYATSIGSAVWPLKNNQFIKTSRDSENETWYKVDIDEGKGLTVAIRPQIDQGDMEIYMYNKSGVQIDYQYYISNGKYGLVSNKAASDTTYYIKVTGSIGIYYIGFYDHYYNNELSMNDNRDFFGSLNTSKKLLSGDIIRNDANIEDWYRVDVKEGQTLSAQIMPQIDSGDMEIFLYGTDGSQLDYQYYISNSKSGSVEKKASKNGTYYIKVTGPIGKYFLSYNLN